MAPQAPGGRCSPAAAEQPSAQAARAEPANPNPPVTFMIFSVMARKPSSPRCTRLAQAVAMSAPDRLPAKPGEM